MLLTTAVALPASVRAEDPVPLSPEATEFLRAVILLSLEEKYVDDDDWGGRKRIQSGLNVRLRHGRLETSRRWKDVNHGMWKRAEVRLLDPEKHFRFQLILLPNSEADETRYRIHAQAKLRVAGQQQNWSNGVNLYSIGGDAIADIAFSGDLKITRSVVSEDGDQRLRILPEMETASLHLAGLRITRVGHVKGTIAREFGRSVESLVRRLIRREGNKLAARINQRIKRKPERFEIPLGFLAFAKNDTTAE